MFFSPKKTTVVKNHQRTPQNTISFVPELLKFIKDGRKFRTFRLAFDQKYQNMKVGDTVQIKPTNKENVVAMAKIIAKRATNFAKLPIHSRLAHESYQNKEEKRRVFNSYYTYLGREIRDDDLFLIIDLKLIN